MNEIIDPLVQSIHDLIRLSGSNPDTFDGELITQQIINSLKLMKEGHDTGQLKLITRSLKEMRYAYRIFNQHKGSRIVSIFGSARTPEYHPDYIAAKSFSTKMASEGWMCMTGAANGIMKAGLEGLDPSKSFGLSIRLPFEMTANSVIEGDEKHIVFRYFFTRKLMFLGHSDALAAFPGGFGTMDELYEALTLIQTGKSPVIPIVLVEGESGFYWREWTQYVQHHLLGNGWISSEDQRFYHVATSVEDAVKHVQKFYSRYNSSRYVKDELVIRLNEALTEKQIAYLNVKYRPLIVSDDIRRVDPFDGESDALDLPRIAFKHNHNHFGLLRSMIDDINEF